MSLNEPLCNSVFSDELQLNQMTDKSKFPLGFSFLFTDDFINHCSQQDLFIALFHWYCVNQGLRTDQGTSLPDNWNANQDLYQITYNYPDTSKGQLSFKALKVADGLLYLHTTLNNVVKTFEGSMNEYMNETYQSADACFKNLDSLAEHFDTLLTFDVNDKSLSIGTNTENQSTSNRLLDFRPSPNPMPAFMPQGYTPPIDPYDYGRSDLIPNIQPGPGGMMFPGPQRGLPRGVGPNIPPFPGARFDPPGAGRFDPDPDHFRPSGRDRDGFI